MEQVCGEGLAMAVKLLEMYDDFVKQYGEFLMDQTGRKYFAQIKDAAVFMLRMINKYPDDNHTEITVHLDSFEDHDDWFRLVVGSTGKKVIIWLHYNDQDVGKLSFDEFPCYDEKDSARDAALREKSRNEDAVLREKNKNDDSVSHQRNRSTDGDGPSRIPI